MVVYDLVPTPAPADARPRRSGPGCHVVANPFSTYYLEILRTEGLNAFAAADLSTVTSTTLSAYDVVILGETPLTAAQVTMFTNWVNGGGNLIAMRPDKQLAGLLGLTDAASTLSNAYLLVNTAAGTPGAGIVNQTIQFHGIADRYTLERRDVARDAVFERDDGDDESGRHDADGRARVMRWLLPTTWQSRSSTHARAIRRGQGRNGMAMTPIRSDDLFFGAKTGDVQPDWVDLNKVAIPQADEQQRFLWNIVLNINANKKPLAAVLVLPADAACRRHHDGR